MLAHVESRFQRLVARAGQFGRQAERMAKGVAMVGVGAGVGLAPAVVAFTNFDDAIRAAAARAEATPAQFDAMREKALELGKAMSFTATEVANTMNALATGGFDPGEINKMTAAVLNLARASGDEAPRAGEILAATMKQFGVSAAEASLFADKLTAAANKSAVSLVDLSESLKYVGPVAADLKISADKTLALAGALGNMGIKGENAGTALRRLSLIIATAEVKLNAIGVTGRDALGGLRPVEDVLTDIRKAMEGMGEGDIAAAMEDLFGLMGITAAQAIGKTAVTVGELEKAIKNSKGTAARTAAFMDAGLGGTFRRLRGSVESAGIAIGEALAPTIGLLARGIKQISDATSKWVRENRELAVAIGMASVGLLGMVAAGGAVIALGAVIKVALAPVMLLASGVQLLFAGLSAGAAAVGTAFSALGAVLKLTLVPLRLLSAALALLPARALAVAALSTAFAALGATVRVTFGLMLVGGQAVGLVVGALGIAFSGLTAAIGLLGGLFAALVPVIGAVAGTLGFLFAPIPLAVISITALILAFRHFGDEAMGVLGAVGARLADFFGPIVASATTAFGHVVDVATTAWGGIMAAIKKGDMGLAFRIAGKALEAIWLEVTFFLREQWEDFTSWWRNNWEDAIDWLAAKLADLADFFVRIDRKFHIEKGEARDVLEAVLDPFGKVGKEGVLGPVVDPFAEGPEAPGLGDAVRAEAALAEKLRKERQKKEKEAALAAIRAAADAARKELDDLVAEAERPVKVLENEPGAAEEVEDLLKRRGHKPPDLAKILSEVKGAFNVQVAKQQFGFGSTRNEDKANELNVEQLKQQQRIRVAVEAGRQAQETAVEVLGNLADAFRLR